MRSVALKTLALFNRGVRRFANRNIVVAFGTQLSGFGCQLQSVSFGCFVTGAAVHICHWFVLNPVQKLFLFGTVGVVTGNTAREGELDFLMIFGQVFGVVVAGAAKVFHRGGQHSGKF